MEWKQELHLGEERDSGEGNDDEEWKQTEGCYHDILEEKTKEFETKSCQVT